MPGNVYNHTSEGTNRAIQHSEAKLVTCAEDILEELHLHQVPEQTQVRQVVPANPTEDLLLGLLSHEPIHMDELVRSAGLATATVSAALCMMELKGMVRRTDNNQYVLAR